MIQFEVGKNYLGSANQAFTVKARSEFFITLTDKYGNQFRKKIRSTNDYKEFISVDGQTVCAVRLITDTTTHAETVQQANTDNITRFEVGKTYRCVDDETWRQTYTITKRTAKTITVTPSSRWIDGDDDSPRLFRVAVMDGKYETFKPQGNYSGAPLVDATHIIDTAPANTQTAPAETAQPETTNDAKARNIVRSIHRREISREALSDTLDTLSLMQLDSMLKNCSNCLFSFSPSLLPTSVDSYKANILEYFEKFNKAIDDWARKNEQDTAQATQKAIEDAHEQDKGVLSYEEAVHALDNVMYSENPGFTWQGYTLFGANACWKILSLSHILDLPALAKYCVSGLLVRHIHFSTEKGRYEVFDEIRNETSQRIDLMNAGYDISSYGGVYEVWQDNFNKYYKKGKYAQPAENDTAPVQDDSQQERPCFTIVPSEYPECPDDSYSDNGGDNSSPLQDTEIDHVHEDTAPVRDCFTIVPTEHIQRPEYASYPDTIPDDIPYHVIHAIDAPQPAAVITSLKPANLPRVNSAVVRTWLHFVAFFLRLWLASRFHFISPEYRAHSFNTIQTPRTQKKANPLFAFIVSKVYPAWVNHKKQFIVVTDRWIDKNGITHITLRDEDNTSYCFTPCINEHGDEFIYFKQWDEFCFSWQDVMQTQSPEYKFAMSFARAKDHDARLKILKKLPLSALVLLAEREKIHLLNKQVQWQCVCDILTDIETRFVALDTNELPHELFTPIIAAKREWDFEQADLLASKSRKRQRKAPNFNAPFIDTRNLSGNELHEATAKNVCSTLDAYTQGTLAAELRNLSVSAIKRIGKCLGLLHQRENGTAQSLANTLSARLFEYRTTPPENSSTQQQQQPKTYTDCNRQIVIIFD